MTTTQAAPAAATPTPAKAKDGGYIVLARDPDGAWATVSTLTARSAGAAIRTTVEKLAAADQAGTFVAIPARSWRPVKVTPKTETKLVVEDTK